ncbi:MAG TPA: DinB family protein [Saprospiraceae bacterium]|nr:DinB family protein [Saprospiraceae bacterium]
MDYKSATNLLLHIRETTLKYYLEKLPWESLVKIPEGYGNNILWNIGHMISVSYSLTFTIAGLAAPTELEMIKKFRKGTFPEDYTEETVLWIRENILNSIHAIDEAWANEQIQSITLPFTTDLGNTIETPSDALAMTLVHDMLHFERIRLFRKLTREKKA